MRAHQNLFAAGNIFFNLRIPIIRDAGECFPEILSRRQKLRRYIGIFFIMPRMSVYGPVKSALMRFAKHASMELAQFGIRVNSIAPGYVDSSPRMASRREQSMDHIPLRRWAGVEEVGRAVLYLASPAAAFCTGTCLLMDGGASNQHYPMEAFRQELE